MPLPASVGGAGTVGVQHSIPNSLQQARVESPKPADACDLPGPAAPPAFSDGNGVPSSSDPKLVADVSPEGTGGEPVSVAEKAASAGSIPKGAAGPFLGRSWPHNAAPAERPRAAAVHKDDKLLIWRFLLVQGASPLRRKAQGGVWLRWTGRATDIRR